MTDADPATQEETARLDTWWRVLRTVLVFYGLGLSILLVSGNPNIFPTVIMLGSFMVPATYVAFFYERRHLSKLTLPTTAKSFVYGGVLGLFSAALLEPIFITRLDFFSAFEVGLIEEFAKIIGVLAIVRQRRHDSELDGLILGAAAGMGFAALESTGYAFTAFLRSGGNLTITVGIVMLRGILSPLGHGTWTAILASALFRESSPDRFHINHRVIGAYLTVSFLHGLWDGLPGLITSLVGDVADIVVAESVVAATGLYLLWRSWREARRLQELQ